MLLPCWLADFFSFFLAPDSSLASLEVVREEKNLKDTLERSEPGGLGGTPRKEARDVGRY